VHDGQTHAVTFGDKQQNGVDNRVTLPGYETDNVAGISAKARRRVLQALWCKLSPILNEPQPDDETEIVEQSPLPQIAQTVPTRAEEPPEMSEREREKTAFRHTYDAIQKRVKDPTQLAKINDGWQAITETKDKQALREMYVTIGGWVEEISKRNVDELQRYCKWCAEGLEVAQ
jgi:hypothetical protein